MKAFGAALGVFAYILIFGLFMSNANNIFGKADTMFTPVLVLLLLAVSVCVCGLIFLTRPFLIFWEEKKPKEAIMLLMQQTFWLIGFAVTLGIWLFLNKI